MTGRARGALGEPDLSLFTVTVPPSIGRDIWNPPPERELFFVELEERPPCRRGEEFELEVDGRIVGRAAVAYLVAPGAQFSTWRLFWVPQSFMPYQ